VADELLDARGVIIEPGDTVIYGFSVGRSVATAEGVVQGAQSFDEVTSSTTKVSLTASGRVRVRIVRRSYSSGEKPVVDIAPDRLVVLKQRSFTPGAFVSVLPASPLPTQAQQARARLEGQVESYRASLLSTEPPEYWRDDLASYHDFCSERLAELHRKLEALDG